MTQPVHVPVMLNEVLDVLSPKDGEVYVDGTFGVGGYTKAFLDAANCTVIAIDRDLDAVTRAQTLAQQYDGRLIVVHGYFGDALELVRSKGFERVDGLVLDIGVSSVQIDQPERGFSFREDGPLDMRMDVSQAQSAADIVNTYEQDDLADLIYKFGEERLSRRIARKIIARRKEVLFETTKDLADIIRSVVPKSKDGLDPATRTFQALRIAVNDELGELGCALESAQELLKVGGRLVVVSFHSLEDGIVKAFLYEKSGKSSGVSRYLPVLQDAPDPVFALRDKKALVPSSHEIEANPRARSAKLRWAVRLDQGSGR